MATSIQRAMALLEAAKGAPIAQSLAVRVADAFVRLDGIDPALLTTAQKADVILDKARQFLIGAVKLAEGAPVAAAAVAGNDAAVDAEFAEA